MTPKKEDDITDEEWLAKKRKTIKDPDNPGTTVKKKVKLASSEPTKLTIGGKEFELKSKEKITILILRPLIKSIKDQSDIDKIITLIPKDDTILRNAIRFEMCEELKKKDIKYTRGSFDDDWSKIRKKERERKITRTKIPIKISTEEIDAKRIGIDEKVINIIKYDENFIVTTKKKTWFIKTYREGNYYPPKEIINGRIGIINKTKDTLNNQIWYTFRFNNFIYYTQNRSQILFILKDYIHKGQLGRDVIIKIIDYLGEKIKTRKAVHILGWNNKWHMPQLEKKGGYSIICFSDYQKKAYKAAKSIIKEHTKDEKEEIVKDLKQFIKITQIDKNKLSIIIGWAMASPFRLAFIKILNLFSVLYPTGATTTGKSSAIEFWCMNFFRIYNVPFSPDDLSSSSRISDCLSASTFPLIFQEVEYIDKKVVPIIKEQSTVNSNFDRKLSAVDLVSRLKTAGMCFDSNFIIKELMGSAINTKIITINFEEKDRIIEDSTWIDLKTKLTNKYLFSLMYKYTKDWTDRDIKDRLKKIKGTLGKEVKSVIKLYPRLIQTYQIITFGINLFKEMFNIKLEKDKILETLIISRTNLTNTLLQLFYYFCLNAREYSIEKGSRIRYINHNLILNKSHTYYYFTQDNLGDFNEYLRKFGIKTYFLNELIKLLQDALSTDKKDIITYGQTTFLGKEDKISPWVIKIKPKFLPERVTIDLDKEDMPDDIKKDLEDDFDPELFKKK